MAAAVGVGHVADHGVHLAQDELPAFFHALEVNGKPVGILTGHQGTLPGVYLLPAHN